MKRSEMMDFERLWEYQQGAQLLKQGRIYKLRKNLAEYFYRNGAQFEKQRAQILIDALKEISKDFGTDYADSNTIIAKEVLDQYQKGKV